MRQEQQNFRLQQAEYMALFSESDPDPVYRIDLNGKIIHTNLPGSALLNKPNYIGSSIHDIISDISYKDVEDIINGGGSKEYTIFMNPKVYRFIFRGIPKMKVGHLYGSDITELKEKERALIAAVQKAENSERLKDHFLSQMSHEIRSPLNSILGFNSIIQEELKDSIPDELKSIFSSVDNSGKRLYRTIDLNLNMAMVMTDTMKVNPQKLNLPEIVQHLLIEYRHYAKEKQLNLFFENNCQNPQAEVDHYSFVTIIQNLIDNSIKYTNTGEIRVGIWNSNNKLFISISDTGIGISEEYKSKLFNVFSQEVTGYGRPFEGNGLGLALSKRLLELNKGEIEVVSQKGAGSTFTISFNSIT
ncbi:MAG: HAMP domain-containing histidine kinase [Ignavibacteriaceae bacterium]|nr:HAMP domain-containing histidine kinase [Ignavibacteriaceae bacterium]